MPNYNLQLVNNSPQPWTFYLYQTLPGQPPNSFSTAWFARQVMPGSQIPFSWSTDYSMVWGQGGQIMPGLTFMAAQTVQADLQAANTSTFGGQPMPSLSMPVQGPPPGSLMINADASVPPYQYAVGIGMSQTTTCIVSAAPNMAFAFNASSPTYWIAASMSGLQVGTVLNVGAISMNAEVTFPPGIYQCICTLNPNNQWSIQ